MLLWRASALTSHMATCPRCKGHLTESHRCPRRARFIALEVAAWAIAGGIAGFLLVALFDLRGQISDDIYLTSCVAGMLVAAGVHRAMRS